MNQLFDKFNELKVLIIGDVMIDSYYYGKVDRISPEAPVPVVSVTRREKRLGGAANVALNIRALGATPIIGTVIGDDDNGKEFLRICESEGIETDGVLEMSDRVTTEKTRVIGNNHQLIRVDSERIQDINETTANEFLAKLETVITKRNVDVIIFEDYDKGVITSQVISKVIELAKSNAIPTTADPKKQNFLNYKGITLFKPNLKELKEGTNIHFEKSSDPLFNKAVDQIKNELDADIIFITLSEDGVYYKTDNEEFKIPAHLRNISDVSGAGDTVISVASLCLALGEDGHMLSFLSNLAGGLVCEKVGVVPIEKEVLLQEAISSIKID